MCKKILTGTVAGGITYFLLGWLFYGIFFMNFFSANMNQCANKTDGSIEWWSLILSNLIMALILTLVLKWSGASRIADGLKTGALFGILFALTINLSFWSMTTMYSNFGTLLTDALVNTVILAVTGMVIVLAWGRGKVSES